MTEQDQTPGGRRPRATAAPAGRAATWMPGVEHIAYGGDYNPEQWPRETWQEDVALMREAGVNLVSIGIFSWALLEPAPGEYDFAWLDDVIDLLHANGIRVDLGTPTASPPAWFYAAHPEARVVTREGTVLGFGSRGMVGHSSPAYRAAAVRITRALADRYGKHPALALWHVHNEYGAPVSEDYSPAAVVAFRAWLRARHGSLEGLNRAWGTAFWGQRYTDWEHVGAPAASASVVNPAHRLDFARFTDDALLRCFVAERDAIRATGSTVPVTTNFQDRRCLAVDQWRWAAEVDIVSNDHYLDAASEHPHLDLALAADLTRSVAGGKPWILMEHSTSAVCWQPRNVAKRRGELARNSYSHLARGADAILFFQWRASRSGAEKFHSAMLPQAGTRTRVWREVTRLGAELARLDELLGTEVRAEAAVLWDWESFWAQDLEWRPSVDVRHQERIGAFHERLFRDGITTDLAHPEGDLSRYRLVVVAASYLLTEAAAANLTRFVEAGGTLLVSFFSGIVDEHDTVHPGPYGAPLARALGVTVDEFLPLPPGSGVTVAWAPGDEDADAPRTLAADVWAEDVVIEDPDGVSVLGRYADGPAAGGPAVTRHRLGLGTAWYLSTRPAPEDLAVLLREVYRDAGLAPSDTPEDLEVVRRYGADREYVVAINHGDAAAELRVPGTDLLGGSGPAPATKIPAGEVRVIRVDPGPTAR